jgi:cell division protein FtsB
VSVRRFLLVPGILLLFAAYVLLNRAGSIRTWHELRSDLEEGEARIQVLEDQNEAMRFEVQDLEDNDFAVERVLREELELAKPGEVLVVLPEVSTSEASGSEAERASASSRPQTPTE